MTPLEEYRRQCRGQPYRELVELYAVRHDPGQLAAEVRGEHACFPPALAREVAALYNRWNREGQRPDIMAMECHEALEQVVDTARDRLGEVADDGGEPSDRTLLRTFRLLTIGLALTAAVFPEARADMDVRTAGELAGVPGPVGNGGDADPVDPTGDGDPDRT